MHIKYEYLPVNRQIRHINYAASKPSIHICNKTLNIMSENECKVVISQCCSTQQNINYKFRQFKENISYTGKYICR